MSPRDVPHVAPGAPYVEQLPAVARAYTTMPASTGPGLVPEDRPVPPAAFLFEPLTVHTLSLTLSDEAIAALAAAPREDVEAVLSYGDEQYTVAVHLKGNMSFRTLDAKAAFKIDFGEYVDGQTFYGQRRLTLNNMIQDGSMMAEHLSYRMFHAARVPAPRHGYARVYVNDVYFGLYGVLDSMDAAWVARTYPRANGNLYKGGYGADVKRGCTEAFELEVDGGVVAPFEDLAALADRIADAHTPADGVAADFDADALRSFLATEVVIGLDDGYVTRANNFLVYGPPGGPWALSPWGTDQAFQSYAGPFDAYDGELAIACVEDVACRAALGDRIDEVVDVWESVDLEGYATEVRTVIGDLCEEDPRRESRCRANQDALQWYLRDRPAYVRKGLREAR